MINADLAISTTDLQQKTHELLDRLAEGGQGHFVAMRDNRPAAVMIATGRSEALVEELEDLRIEATARARRETPREAYISKQDMDAFLDRF